MQSRILTFGHHVNLQEDRAKGGAATNGLNSILYKLLEAKLVSNQVVRVRVQLASNLPNHTLCGACKRWLPDTVYSKHQLKVSSGAFGKLLLISFRGRSSGQFYGLRKILVWYWLSAGGSIRAASCPDCVQASEHMQQQRRNNKDSSRRTCVQCGEVRSLLRSCVSYIKLSYFSHLGSSFLKSL